MRITSAIAEFATEAARVLAAVRTHAVTTGDPSEVRLADPTSVLITQGVAWFDVVFEDDTQVTHTWATRHAGWPGGVAVFLEDDLAGVVAASSPSAAVVHRA